VTYYASALLNTLPKHSTQQEESGLSHDMIHLSSSTSVKGKPIVLTRHHTATSAHVTPRHPRASNFLQPQRVATTPHSSTANTMSALRIPLSRRAFSTAPARCFPRITRDRNPNRGVSPLRRVPQKEPLGAEKYGLPVPAPVTSKVVTDENHGLWGFFRDKKALPTPAEDFAHGTTTTGRGDGRRRLTDYRSPLDRRGAPPQVVGGPAQALVGVREGA
jgi:hypothetical protein